jgi:hypothetical protein
LEKRVPIGIIAGGVAGYQSIDAKNPSPLGEGSIFV